MANRFTTAQREALAKRFGVSVDEIHLIVGSGQILPQVVDSPDPIEDALVHHLASEMESAGGPPLITNGKPTTMRIVAWMVHEGINLNRLAFVREELPAAAARIGTPDMLVMDWNHSAVLGYDGEQKIIGVWYKADYAFDPKAKKGAGAWGILLTGVMFSWANPDIADQMLAEQSRSGRLDFSMACINSSQEIAEDDDGTYVIGHNPVFFTNSALDVAPADPDARGLGAEGSSSTTLEEDFSKRLRGLLAGGLRAAAAATTPAAEPAVSQEATQMDELNTKLAALEEQLLASTNANTALATRVSELETEAAARETTRIAELSALETSNEELRIARETLTASNAEQLAEIERLNAALDAAQLQLNAIAESEAEKARTAKVAERLASLPDSMRERLNKRGAETVTRLQSKWADMTDEAWEAYKTDELGLGVDALKIGYVRRSATEGLLPGLTDTDTGLSVTALSGLKK